jgi:hypothetical protein
MLELLTLLITIPGVYSNYTASCKTYTCQTLPVIQCINRTTSSEGLQNCSSATQFCNTTTGNCEAIQPSSHYPGELCSSTCAYGSCSSGKCVGRTYNQACTDSYQCNPGLYCKTVCTYQLKAGSVCSKDEECANSYFCNLDAGSTTGHCVQFGSLDIGARASDCKLDSGTMGISIMCKSGACAIDSMKCVAAGVSFRAAPNPCKADSDCTGTFNNESVYSSCKCGMNPTGLSYCAPFLGDSQGLSYLNVTKLALIASENKCNTKRRLEDDCYRAINHYYQVATARSDYKYYPYTVNAPDCVRQVYSTYFNTTKAITSEFNSNFISLD